MFRWIGRIERYSSYHEKKKTKKLFLFCHPVSFFHTNIYFIETDLAIFSYFTQKISPLLFGQLLMVHPVYVTEIVE